MGQGKSREPLWRRVLPDRYSQIMALFLAFYGLFLVSPTVGLRLRQEIGFDYYGWPSFLVIAFGVLCLGVNLGRWTQRYWMIPKLGFLFSFIFASEDFIERTIIFIRIRKDPIRSGIRFEDGFEYGMAFYSLGLAFFFIFLFLKPAISPENEGASGNHDGPRQPTVTPGHEGRH